MFSSTHRGNRREPNANAGADLVDDDDDGSSIIDDTDVDVPVDVDVDVVSTQKPHFLDDAMPPPEMIADFERVLSFGAKSDTSPANAINTIVTASSGEQLKMDKKYERDGEISDYELAASGYTKKEFTQDDNTLNLPSVIGKSTFTKPKHFLDENPIPPDYMLLATAADHELRREHRSLDRNFERQEEQESALMAGQLMKSSSSSGGGRKSSLDRGGYGGGVHSSGSHSGSMSSSRISRERNKDLNSSYTLSCFLHSAETPSPPPALQRSIPKGGAWASSSGSAGSCSFDRLYGSLPMAHTTGSAGIDSNCALGTVDDIVDVDRLGPKVECVYSLLSMLGSNDPSEMSKKFLELSRTPETCSALRRAGCVPLLVQMMHSDGDDSVRKCASMALHNVVHSHVDEKTARREAKVLRLLEQILDYCNFLKTLLQSGGEAIADDSERHPLAAISSLMKVSFDEEHRHAMCELGALQAIPNLVHLDHAVHGPKPEDQCCNSLRRYALMALTNLTFGDEHNKAYLCSQKLFMEALVAQLDSAPDDLLQVTASVLRNLSWRADSNMKAVLNEIGTVTALARAAMKNKSENTLKAILSALWNLSAHCSTNKAEFCAVDGALAFLVDMLTYEGPSKTLKIIENAGGILRNVSSHIAVREHYRQILRERNCLSILLQQLKSESLTVVSNSCGTLWNLSARCPEDQKFLWDNGAVPMLRSLIHSKHAMISEGSASALKNLLNFRPAVQSQNQLDPIARSMGLRKLPTLNARKQKALQQELGGKQHAETCDNLDISGNGCIAKEEGHLHQHTTLSVVLQAHRQRFSGPAGSAVPPGTSVRLTRSAMLTKSESRDSVFSAKSDTAYENLMRSHSASDANRKKLPYAAAAAVAVYSMENDVEPTEVEQPIDYSAKYCEKDVKAPDECIAEPTKSSNSNSTDVTYQETDLDQPTDFSLRYAEQQIEPELDVLPNEHAGRKNISNISTSRGPTSVALQAATGNNRGQSAVSDGNEILLILEDTVKCYQTEDTPYVISNAASVTDLRQAVVKSEVDAPAEIAKHTDKPKKYQRMQQMPNNAAPHGNSAYGSGSYTPEKPINYCEEGTPGYFSRYESLSSLDESPPPNQQIKTKNMKTTKSKSNNKDHNSTSSHTPPRHVVVVEATAHASGNATTMNSAQETPLMFSRHSSMDSLVEEGEDEIGVCDDKSSVVSDFSRLASGVISPSEIPDSPTQSMPQSPRRTSNAGQANNIGGGGSGFLAGASPVAPSRGSAVGIATAGAGIGLRGNAAVGEDTKRPLRSVFEDDLSTFNVENTPAQFSCRTSLSNLSILDDENSLPPSRQPIEGNSNAPPAIVSEGEDEEVGDNIDDILLANCINMGMNRTTITAAESKKSKAREARSETVGDSQLPADEPKHYYTEDTPALLSKVGSNTNLSAISICSSNNLDELKELHAPTTTGGSTNNRHSLTLSDDVSSNASESGAAGQSFDLLQQCIEVGMKKPNAQPRTIQPSAVSGQQRMLRQPSVTDPIAMLRRGGNVLPPYLPVTDEMSKYLVEDSPCNFSVASGLSNLTVGSSLVGPAVQLKGNQPSTENLPNMPATSELAPERAGRAENNWHDDSLSSLSIDSEDDTNLLSQAIAAGCNRPKSNLGFSSTSSTANNNNNNKRISLSASQPIPINVATSSSSLNSSATARHYQRQQQQHHSSDHGAGHNSLTGQRYQNGNDSYSSVDSSDSNDNQAKSLFELCIRTGMNKASREGANHRRQHTTNNRRSGGSSTTQSNPNLKQFDSLPLQLHTQSRPMMPLPTNTSTALPATTAVNRHLRERERKDEKLLMECISTGISKKIGSNSSNSGVGSIGGTSASAAAKYAVDNNPHSMSMPMFSTGDGSHSTGTGSKNVLATSAAAPALCHPHAAISYSNAHSTAAPDVTKTNNTGYNSNCSTISSNSTSNSSNDINISCSSVRCWAVRATNNADIIDVVKNPATDITTTAHNEGNLPNHANGPVVQKTSSTGCKQEEPLLELEQLPTQDELNSPSTSLDNTATSDDSNESFIIETTVSLEMRQSRSSPPLTTSQKHKDPDLMLKSVERLTLEFVSSAEQLRTNASNVATECSSAEQPRIKSGGASISIGGTSNSNNTWNEDTCPNDDVSFPSVSVTAPVVASLNYDDEDDDDDEDEDQATDADHKDLHDFAEITPINEEQPQPSLLLLERADTGTQPSSLETETETDTLVNDGRSLDIPCYNATPQESTTSSGINFQLGGAVQSAALSLGGHHMIYGSSRSAIAAAQAAAAAAAMTNSTIIAIEARALAENLQHGGSVSADEEESIDLTFSINSLDLDNIRPPSGMESLNISGYYQQEPQSSAYHSLGVLQRRGSSTPQSPQMMIRSPKFPRKSLPHGLVAKRALGQLPTHLTGSAESINSSCNMLENIKPPSLMDELLDSMISVASIQSEVADGECSMATTLSAASNYETAAGGQMEGADYDDNTVTLQSCYETMPHDNEAEENSFHSGAGSTPLPTDDYEFSSAESTPQKSAASPTPANGEKRTLTPKQKRKVAKDRYRTYTISSDVKAQMADETLQIEIFETEALSNVSSCSRRRADAERYRTQTIVYTTDTATTTTTTITSNELAKQDINASTYESGGPQTFISNDDCPSENMSSLREFTQKFKFITMPVGPSKSAPEAEAAEMRNAPDGGECTSMECDQNSDTESRHDQQETYAIVEDSDDLSEEDTTEDSDSEEQSIAKPPARARIAKPIEIPDLQTVTEAADEQAKAVRGRKKPAYISPYSIQYQRTISPQTRIATNKTLTSTTAANGPRKRDSKVAGLEATAMRLTTTKKTLHTQLNGDAKAASTQQPPATPSLERQGTFVQEEPTVSTCQVPVVVSEVKAAAASGGSPQRSSKLPTKRATGAAAAKTTTTFTQPATTRKIPIATKSSSPKHRKVAATISAAMPQRSNSNAAIRVTSSAARITRVSATTPPTRSNSNLNNRDTAATAAAQATKNAAAKINQAQSRIANIWKRVNDVKSKQQDQYKAPRANATRASSAAVVSKLKSQQTKSSPALNAPKTAIGQRTSTQLQQQQQQQKKQTLIRSSTFDNTPNGVTMPAKVTINAGAGAGGGLTGVQRGGRK
ncbi:unnamed protein product [Ceratitis capitata]|uniref:(Mediterranean fruit fly) hypothetical protein n=1 Tax=Ceratitis capitata TaxID=7213 RepID=A0A811U107_CERCA|nr:unnamed protein product [Ceratitis capitata]